MKFLNDPDDLQREFKRLLNAYDHYYWMVAWAGDSFNLSEALHENQEKIRQIIVGLHFYQTHPRFIKVFNSHPGVRFMHDTSELFHPKVYLFTNSEESWELLIGSANFTRSAYARNTEACALIREDESDSTTYQKVRQAVDDAWNCSRPFEQDELKAYCAYWETQNSKIQSLQGYLEPKENRIPIFQIPVVQMNWEEYIDKIYAANGAAVEERIHVLDLVQSYFHHYPTFADMPQSQRAHIGGYRWANEPADFRLFGNMQNSTTFTHEINTNPGRISHALEAIPLSGEVTKAHYDEFVVRFEAALNGGNKYRSATRLLAMKRPDTFFCISMANYDRLATDFELGSATMDLGRYWDDIILKIHQSNWFNRPNPKNDKELTIEKYKAAFLDAIYFDPAKIDMASKEKNDSDL